MPSVSINSIRVVDFDGKVGRAGEETKTRKLRKICASCLYKMGKGHAAHENVSVPPLRSLDIEYCIDV